MAEVVRPARGGYLRPFGAAVFIRDFLNGEGPKYGVARVDPRRGAPQADIHASYKLALHRAIAEDSAAWEAADAIRIGRPMTTEQVEERASFYMARIPTRLTRARYHSFLVYFGLLKRLGWVEPTGETEPSEAQETMAAKPGEPAREVGRPRVYYRLTATGRRAAMNLWTDPIMALYKYDREKRSAKKKRLYYTPPGRRGRRRTRS